MKRDSDFNSQPPEYVKGWYTEFIFGYLEPDGVFMLRLLSSNTSDFVCTEVKNLWLFYYLSNEKICLFFSKVINHLWQTFYNKDPKQLKRKLQRELGSESTTSEIQRQVSDPVDLPENDDSIRRRTTHFPPPPTHSSSLEKTNHSYGSLITVKRSSLTPLVEGDV